ncbi:MAG TPA: hypothetical protein VEA16_16335, partial [Vicinamibacterales bacterium]|nr:hypothetical protein [Vicinamibacterales bacterium]
QGFADVKRQFEAAESRDKELGAEIQKVREDMHRRFDESDRKNDEQFTLLKHMVRNLGGDK